ncbi:HAD family hydrolase [Vibrio comitans]
MVDLPNQQGKMCDWPEVYTVDGATDALKGLSKNYRLYVATNAVNSAESDIQQAFQRVGLDRYITGYFCKANLGIGKGSAEFFHKIVDTLHTQPDSVLMVGDTLDKDINPAIEAGLKVVWLNRQSSHKEGVQNIPQIESLHDLSNTIENLL